MLGKVELRFFRSLDHLVLVRRLSPEEVVGRLQGAIVPPAPIPIRKGEKAQNVPSAGGGRPVTVLRNHPMQVGPRKSRQLAGSCAGPVCKIKKEGLPIQTRCGATSCFYLQRGEVPQGWASGALL